MIAEKDVEEALGMCDLAIIRFIQHTNAGEDDDVARIMALREVEGLLWEGPPPPPGGAEPTQHAEGLS